MDFTSPTTLVWNYNCTTTAIGSYDAGSCENNPTLTTSNFSSPDYISTFTD